MSSVARPRGALPTSNRERKPSYFEPWKSQHRSSGPTDSTRQSPARSDGSNRTAVGSDFESEKASPVKEAANPPTQMPRLQRNSSSLKLKRTFEETEPDDERTRQHDDHAPRHKRRQPEVPSAYRYGLCVCYLTSH